MGRVTFFLLCCFVAFLPFEMMAYFEDIPSGGKLVGMVMVGSACLAFLTGQRIRLLSKPMVMRVVLVLFSTLSIGWSVAPQATLSNIPRIAQLLVFVLIIWEFAVTYNDQIWLLRSLIAGMLVPLAMSLTAYHGASSLETEGGQRFSGGGQDLNYIAYLYAVSVLITVYLATSALPLDRYFRWFYWALAVLFALANLLAASRGGFVCLVGAGIFAMFLAGISRRRILSVLQILAVLMFVFVLARYIVPTALLNRVTREQDLTDDPRARIWAKGLTVLMQNPVLGVGGGAYAPATAVAGEKSAVAHNVYISVLVELGIVGLVLFLIYTFMLFRAAWRLPRREKLLWMGGMVIWFFNANSAGSQNDKFGWFLNAMVLVAAAAYAQLCPARKLPLYPGRIVPVTRRLMPPRFGKT